MRIVRKRSSAGSGRSLGKQASWVAKLLAPFSTRERIIYGVILLVAFAGLLGLRVGAGNPDSGKLVSLPAATCKTSAGWAAPEKAAGQPVPGNNKDALTYDNSARSTQETGSLICSEFNSTEDIRLASTLTISLAAYDSFPEQAVLAGSTEPTLEAASSQTEELPSRSSPITPNATQGQLEPNLDSLLRIDISDDDGKTWQKLHEVDTSLFIKTDSELNILLPERFNSDLSNFAARIQTLNTGSDTHNIVLVDAITVSYIVGANQELTLNIKDSSGILLSSDLPVLNSTKDYRFELVINDPNDSLIDGVSSKLSQVVSHPGSTMDVEATIASGSKQLSKKQLSASWKQSGLTNEQTWDVDVEMPEDARPGRYSLTLEVAMADGTTQTTTQEYLWGVLALNVDKSVYRTSDTAFLQFGVVDDNGHTICDAQLRLEVIAPNGATTVLDTADGTINYSNQCSGDSYASIADYSAYYPVSDPGTYQMRLTANTENGERSVTDNFTASDDSQYDFARVGPTRIYPPVGYPVIFNFTPTEDFDGRVLEQIPASFQVTEITEPRPEFDYVDMPSEVFISGEHKYVAWDFSVAAGQTVHLGYEFLAPVKSPQFYLLGPAVITDHNVESFVESRQWQIASDATLDFEDWEGFTTDGTTTFTGSSWHNVAAEGQCGATECDWQSDKGGTPSSGTGPGTTATNGTDHTLGTTSGIYLYTETSSPIANNDIFILESDSFDADTYSIDVDFWYHMQGTAMANNATLHFDVYDGSWNNDEWTATGNLGNVWNSGSVDLDAYTGTIQLRFRWEVSDSGSAWQNDVALDDITITGTLRNINPSPPSLHDIPFDNEQLGDTTPDFEFTASDPDGTADIIYHIQIDDDQAFGSPVVNCESDTTCATGAGSFSNTVTGTDTDPFNEAERIRFTPTTTLSNNSTYWWRVRAEDDSVSGGSGNYGDWTTPVSFTVTTGTDPSAWLQTTDEQFSGDTFSNTEPNGSDSIDLTSGATFEILAGASETTWGSGTSNPNDPFNTYYHDSRAQAVYLASELNAAGITGAATITAIDYKVNEAPGRPNLANLRVEFKNTTSSSTSVWEGGWTTNYGPTNVAGTSLTTGGAWNTFSLAANFSWDGTSNLMINTSRDDTAYVANGGIYIKTGLSGTRSWTGYCDSCTPALYSRTSSGSGDNAAGQSFVPSIRLTTADSSSGTVLSPEIPFSLITSSGWDEAIWSTTETSGDVKMSIYYTVSTACDTIVPDSALTGNSSGFDVTSSPLDISGLATATYDTLCLKASLTSGTSSPTLDDWKVTWNSDPNTMASTPTLGETPAFDNVSTPSTTPTLGKFTSTDPDLDALEYQIQWDTNINFSSPTTKTSSDYPTDAGWSAATFASGSDVIYIVQSSAGLTNGTTYWWRVRARDPSGTNQWTNYTTEVRSFTISTGNSSIEWYQTIDEQFDRATSTSDTETYGSDSVRLVPGSTFELLTGAGESTWGSGTSNPNDPFNTYYHDSRAQAVYLASELNAAGITGATTITAIDYKVNEAPGRTNIQNLRIRLKHTTNTATTVWEGGWSNNYGPTNVAGTSLNTGGAWNTFSLTTPFAWNGTSNLMIDTSRDDTAYVANGGIYIRTGVGTNRSWTGYCDSCSPTLYGRTAAGTGDNAAGLSSVPSIRLTTADSATGSIMSPEIDFDWVVSPSWGEVKWSTTETQGDVKLSVYYTASTACDTIVPDSALTGNSSGFDVTSSPFGISALSTTTYNRICLKATLTAGATASPTLDNWGVTWQAQPATAPDAPTSLIQQKTDDTVISVGGWVNATSIKLEATATDDNNPDTLQLCVEVDLIGTAFSNTEDVCSSNFSYGGTGIPVYHTITGLTDAAQYHWQARVKDGGGLYSSWVSYGGNAESARDFGVDTTGPTGAVYDGPTVDVDADYNDGSLDSLSSNWNINSGVSGVAEYEYSIGTASGVTDIVDWTSTGTTDSASASSLVLNTSQPYFFNVRTTDNANNQTTISSDGIYVSPAITFSSAPPQIDFGALNIGNSYTSTASTTLTTSTNAYNGYIIRAFADGFLTNPGADVIGMFSGGTYASPDEWLGGDIGFGYSSNDSLVQGSNLFGSSPCAGGGNPPCYAPFSTSPPGDIVADHTALVSGTPINNESFVINHRVTSNSAQEAGEYQTAIVYTITAIY